MTKYQHLSPRSATVLAALKAASEGDAVNGFKLVYLDNASAGLGMSGAVFAAHLGVLEKAGYYKVQDGFAWGWVKEVTNG